MKESLIKNKGWLHITGLFALIYAMAHLGATDHAHQSTGMIWVLLASIDSLTAIEQFVIYIVGICGIAGIGLELLQGNLNRGNRLQWDDVVNGVIGGVCGWALAAFLPTTFVLVACLLWLGVIAVAFTYFILQYLGIVALFRKFAVKQFALDWNYKLIGMNGPRAGAWILPLFIANGLHIAFSEEVDWWSAICWPLMAALIVAVYLGFVYFHIWPVRYSECDRSQKLQFGQRNKHEMTAEEIEEWKQIYHSAQ